jgi:hypothetical protein
MSSKNDALTNKNDPVKKSDPAKNDPVKGPGSKSEATAHTAVDAPPTTAGSAAATVYEDVRLLMKTCACVSMT